MMWTRAQSTLLEESKRHAHLGGSNWLLLAEHVLAPDESVLAAVVGSTSTENEPVLMATDRRILLARPRLSNRWTIKGELPADAVVGAEVRRTWLAQTVRVAGRDGRSVELRTREKDHAERMAALVTSLVAQGRERR